MDKEKVSELFSELLRELMTHNYESENGINIVDFRDDVIIIANKWERFRFGGQTND